MTPLKRLEIIKEVVDIFEKNGLTNDLEKFWVLNAISSIITLPNDPLRFKCVETEYHCCPR